ncbi:hypothetical protein [Heyndrickxia camelliae]|uniref:Uncharacterized protein n=1 Tax=Heyndrickxia camelliae TaxID=1707093 RepID=A0A2N3LD54_9BACI|nr:hypothetical protein [Heyndrickxia camelliae]PKR82495.1 hypothetical protein CWO92_24145 [Heyndrickxia camelliae]
MKKSTSKIIEQFPFLHKKIDEILSGPFSEEVLNDLDNEVDKTFVKLAYFFEYPHFEGFSLSLLYKHLENDWLEFALSLIYEFFTKDTFLIQNPSHSIIDGDNYLTQTEFGRYLEEQGLNYTKNEMAVYKKRGKLPKEDILIAGTSYWSKETVERFAKEKLNEISADQEQPKN